MFPLLGILGLGAAALAKPFYDEWSEERMGRRSGEALAGVGDDPDEQQKALLLGGLLSPEDYAGFGQDRENTILGLGPAWANVGIARDRLTHDMGIDRERLAAERRNMGLGGVDQAFMIPDPEGQLIDRTQAMNSLVAIESGGDYNAMGPVTDSGDRAYGKYQIMGANIPSWSEKVLGVSMTPEEFLADTAAQDKIASTIFGENISKYGLADAVSIWHSGVPLAQAAAEGRHDGNMSTTDYVSRVLGGYGVNAAAAARDADPIYQQSKERGQNWIAMEPAGREEILSAESGLTTMKATVDYLEETTAGGRAFDPSVGAQMQTEWNLTVLPYLQSLFQAGAMQEAELALFQDFAGDGFSWSQLSGAEQSKMKGIIASAEARLANKKRSLGLSDVTPDPFAGFEVVQ